MQFIYNDNYQEKSIGKEHEVVQHSVFKGYCSCGLQVDDPIHEPLRVLHEEATKGHPDLEKSGNALLDLHALAFPEKKS